MTVIQQAIGRNDGYQQQYQQNDSYRFVGLRLLHVTTVIAQCIIGRHLLKQLRVDAVVITVQLPLVQSQGCHGTLVTDIKNDMVVGNKTIVEPLDFGWHQRWVTHLAHQVATVWHLLTVMLVQIVSTGIGKAQCTLVVAIDIAEIGRIGIDTGHAKGINLRFLSQHLHG